MPIFIPGGGRGGGGGGGGLVLRKPPDEFTGATLAACRTARDTAFGTGGSLAGALSEYQANQSLAIILNPTGDDNNVFQTYAPGQDGQAYNSAQWVDRTDAIQGNPGQDGDDGAPGQGGNLQNTRLPRSGGSTTEGATIRAVVESLNDRDAYPPIIQAFETAGSLESLTPDVAGLSSPVSNPSHAADHDLSTAARFAAGTGLHGLTYDLASEQDGGVLAVLLAGVGVGDAVLTGFDFQPVNSSDAAVGAAIAVTVTGTVPTWVFVDLSGRTGVAGIRVTKGSSQQADVYDAFFVLPPATGGGTGDVVKRVSALPTASDDELRTIFILPDGTQHWLEKRAIPSADAVPEPSWSALTAASGIANGFAATWKGVYDYTVDFAAANSVGDRAFILSGRRFCEIIAFGSGGKQARYIDPSAVLPAGWTWIGDFPNEAHASNAVVVGRNVAFWSASPLVGTDDHLQFSNQITTAPVTGHNEYHWHRLVDVEDLAPLLARLLPIAAGSTRGAKIATARWTGTGTFAVNTNVGGVSWTLESDAPDFVRVPSAAQARLEFLESADVPDEVVGIWFVSKSGSGSSVVEHDRVLHPYNAHQNADEETLRFGTDSAAPANNLAVVIREQSVAVAAGNARPTRYLIRGAGTALPSDGVVECYWAVARGPKGDPGPPATVATDGIFIAGDGTDASKVRLANVFATVPAYSSTKSYTVQGELVRSVNSIYAKKSTGTTLGVTPGSQDNTHWALVINGSDGAGFGAAGTGRPPVYFWWANGATARVTDGFPYTQNAPSADNRLRFQFNGANPNERVHVTDGPTSWFVAGSEVANLDSGGAPPAATDRVVFKPPAGTWKFKLYAGVEEDAGDDGSRGIGLFRINAGTDDTVVAGPLGTAVSAELFGFAARNITVVESDEIVVTGSEQFYWMALVKDDPAARLANWAYYMRAEKVA